MFKENNTDVVFLLLVLPLPVLNKCYFSSIFLFSIEVYLITVNTCMDNAGRKSINWKQKDKMYKWTVDIFKIQMPRYDSKWTNKFSVITTIHKKNVCKRKVKKKCSKQKHLLAKCQCLEINIYYDSRATNKFCIYNKFSNSNVSFPRVVQ